MPREHTAPRRLWRGRWPSLGAVAPPLGIAAVPFAHIVGDGPLDLALELGLALAVLLLLVSVLAGWWD